ncbi:MAG: ELM1/GtrOC1 family putative glycosyltransferase [Pseudomonadota bacterium]
MSSPRVWLLLGKRRGDNNQLLALGEALGVPFETRTIHYHMLARLRMKLVPVSLGHVTADSRSWLKPPWPDLVIGIGRRTVPVARWIKRQNDGRTRIVRLGHPRAPNRLFDLVITTRQYPVPDGENVLRLPLAMNRFHAPPMPTPAETAVIEQWPRPHLLLSLGGTAPMWRLDLTALGDALRTLTDRVRHSGGTVIAIGSPRTPDVALDLVRSTDGVVLIEPGQLRYPVALASADEHFVTADSVSMISEAILTGKPVGLIAVEPDARGRRRLGPDPETTRIRDPRRFWRDVEGRGLVGTVDKPKSGKFEAPVAMAVAALKQRLGSLFD